MRFRGEKLRGLRKTNIFIQAGLFLLLWSIPVQACDEVLPTTEITIKGESLYVELAATPSARACGLSHRSHLPEDHGMLFVYPSPEPLAFWMKETEIPLSIAFIDDGGQILSIQKMVPMQTETIYRSPGPVRYALEVNQDWFADHGIQVQDVVEFKLPVVLNIR